MTLLYRIQFITRRSAVKSFVAALLCLLSTVSLRAQEKIAPPTAILGAFGEEVTLLESLLADKREQRIQGITFFTGKLNNRPVVVARSGIGKVNAAITTTLLIEHFNPSEVIFTGIAGAINPDLFPGDVVIALRTAQHDYGATLSDRFEHRGAPSPVYGRRNPVFIPADPRLLAAAERASSRAQFEKIKVDETERTPRIIKGVIVTGDSFISSPSKKAELRKMLEADAVEIRLCRADPSSHLHVAKDARSRRGGDGRRGSRSGVLAAEGRLFDNSQHQRPRRRERAARHREFSAHSRSELSKIRGRHP